jgi:hypothetical protein
MSIGLVRCDHDGLPANVVCIYLLNLQSTEWIPALAESYNQCDWLCPECFKKAPKDNIKRDDLRWLLDRNYPKIKSA